jgi:hypothetical protein
LQVCQGGQSIWSCRGNQRRTLSRELPSLSSRGPAADIFQFYGTMEAPRRFKKTAVAPVRLGHLAVVSSEGGSSSNSTEFLGFQYRTISGDRDLPHLQPRPPCDQRSQRPGLGFITSPSSSRTPAYRSGGGRSSCRRGQATLGPRARRATHRRYHYDPDKVIVELYTEMDQLFRSSATRRALA